VRKVMYTLHGKKGAIRVEDEDVELAVLEAGPGVVAAWVTGPVALRAPGGEV